jgi:proteasome lid subunit RPN8/RPN11
LKRNEAQGTGSPSQAPAEIRIGRGALTLLERLLTLPAPEEGCALLLGERPCPADARSPWRLLSPWPCRNVWEPAGERKHRFAIDPREQLLAQKWARSRGLLLLGSAHSHPASAAEPSAFDRTLTLGPTLMLILGASKGGERMELACWWLEEPVQAWGATGPAPARRLVWRMED